MMKTIAGIGILMVGLAVGSALAGEAPAESEKTPEVVVTATRIATPTEQVGSSITVIDAEDVANRKQYRAEQALRGTPGVDVVRNGGPGGRSSVYIRGANSQHTLVMIDGIEMNDPANAARGFSFANLGLENVKRIEVLRGPQSTLYGSDSMGGVINVITNRGKVQKPKVTVELEAGSLETRRGSLNVNGGNKFIQFSAGFSALLTEGISHAPEEDGNQEDDSYTNHTFYTNLTLTPNDIFNLDLSARYVETRADYDDWDYATSSFTDDEKQWQDKQSLYLRAEPQISLFEGRWVQKLGVSLADHKREQIDPFSWAGDDAWEDTYWSDLTKLDWQHEIVLHKTNTLVLGAETEEETYQLDSDSISPYDARTNAVYAQDQIGLFDCWYTTLGLRRDHHDAFGGKTTWRATTALLIKKTGTKLKGSYGTGFKAPSLYQLYAPRTRWGPIGNQNLKPETSRGYDVGLEQSLWDDRVRLGAIYFHNKFEDMIEWTFADGYVNLGEGARTKGWETFLELSPLDALSVRLQYTRLDTHDEERDDELHRRARNKFSAEVNYRFLENRANVNLGVNYTGSRWNDLPNTIRVDGYTLVNLAVHYDVNEHWRLFGRIENLLDEEYREVDGYGTPGATAYFGTRLTF